MTDIRIEKCLLPNEFFNWYFEWGKNYNQLSCKTKLGPNIWNIIQQASLACKIWEGESVL